LKFKPLLHAHALTRTQTQVKYAYVSVWVGASVCAHSFWSTCVGWFWQYLVECKWYRIK